jgi:Predicted metalloendopeptidase
MDEAAIEKKAASSINDTLGEIRSAKTREALAAMMGKQNADFHGGIFGVGIDVDIKDPKHYAVYLGQAGLGLPDRDYYLKPDFSAKKDKYKAYAGQMLKLLEWPDPEKRAAEIIEFETKIADASWTKTQQRDPIATYNAMSVAELETLAPKFAWRKFLSEAGLARVERVVVAERSAFPKIADIFDKTPTETLQAWQAFNVADHAAPYLSKAFCDALFDMRNKTLSGQAEQKVRWKRGVQAVSGGDYGAGDRYDRFGNLGWGVGQLYTAKYFPPAAKAKIEELVANVKLAMHERIKGLDWMGEATKAQALKKLDTYNIKVGYPDKSRDYSKVEIRDDDLIGNVRRAGAADWAFYVQRLPEPVDMSDWGMTPQTNDAYKARSATSFSPPGFFSRRFSMRTPIRRSTMARSAV